MSIEHLMQLQGGVISRRQLIEHGADDNLVERMIRRRLWRPIHPGVYVDHTGVPTDEEGRMAAVLYAWPAALAGESALIAHGLRNFSAEIVSVAIDAERRVQPQPGLRVMRLQDFDRRTLWPRIPPRLRLEDATLQVASERWRTGGEAGAVAVLADACQQRRTTASRLRSVLGDYPCLCGRSFIGSILGDVASGAFSLLEHRYLTRVERPHGLPRATRQAGFRDRRVGFRDVLYAQQGLVIELDGRLGHEWALDQWADLERDLRSATDELQTTRLGWGAVASPCRLAPLVGELLQVRGWAGSAGRCRRC